MRAGLLWLSRQGRLQRLTAEFGPARRMARRFVAGETLADALATVAALRRDGMDATVAFLGEHTTAAAEARVARAFQRAKQLTWKGYVEATLGFVHDAHEVLARASAESR